MSSASFSGQLSQRNQNENTQNLRKHISLLRAWHTYLRASVSIEIKRRAWNGWLLKLLSRKCKCIPFPEEARNMRRGLQKAYDGDEKFFCTSHLSSIENCLHALSISALSTFKLSFPVNKAGTPQHKDSDFLFPLCCKITNQGFVAYHTSTEYAKRIPTEKTEKGYARRIRKCVVAAPLWRGCWTVCYFSSFPILAHLLLHIGGHGSYPLPYLLP